MKKKPRIAYVLGYFPLLSETFIGQEIRAMEAAGYEIAIIALHRPEAAAQPLDEELVRRTIYFTAAPEEEKAALLRRYRFRFRRIRAYARGQTVESRASLAVNAARMADILKATGCTRVHAHFAWNAAAYAIVGARLLGLPVSFTCHGSDVYARPWDLTLKCRHADMIFGVAPTITADLRRIAKKTPCYLVYSGVDTAYFKPLAEGAQKNGRWLFIGRLVDCKGGDDLLGAWSRLATHERPPLDIVGDGALKAQLQEMAQALGLESSVTFLGSRPSSWIAEHAPHYRAFIAPFRQGRDGGRDASPTVLKEVMAMGLPIVTTRFVDVPELVGSECALLCPPASPEALAEAVRALEHLPLERLQCMGYAGRQRVERYFTTEQQVTHISKLWKLPKER
mgnify:CR=1 FL=1